MGSISNAYALLAQTGGSTPSVSTKTKKNKKKKASASNNAEPVANAQNLGGKATPENGTDFSFQVVRHKAKPTKGSSTVDGVASSAALEQAVASCKDVAARQALVSSWLQQLSQSSGSSFRRSLVASAALERLLEAHAKEAKYADAAPLAALLAATAHDTIPATTSEALADLLVACGALSTRDPLAPRSQAISAATACAALLRRGLPCKTDAATSAASAAAALAELRTRVESLETALNKATSTKEESRLTSELVNAARQCADLALPAQGAGSSPEAVAALGALETLRAALVSRQRVLDDAANGQGVDAQIEAVTRAFNREDSSLAAAEAAAEDALAEAKRQLAVAQAAADEARTRRAAARRQHEHTVEHLRNGAEASAAAAEEVAEGVDAALSGASVFESALRSTVSATATNTTNNTTTFTSADAEAMVTLFASATQRAMEAGVKHLKDLVTKAGFFQERLAASARQVQQLKDLGDSGAAAEHAKQRSNVEKLLRDVRAAAADAERSVQSAAEAWKSREGRLRSSLGREAALTMRRIDALLREAVEISETIASGKAAPLATAPKTSAAAAANGSSKAARARAAAASPKEPATATTTATTSVSPTSGRSTPSASVGTTDTFSRPTSSAAVSAEMAALEHRLAALEQENRRKDAQIAAMLAAASVDIPTPPPPSKSAAPAWGRAL